MCVCMNIRCSDNNGKDNLIPHIEDNDADNNDDIDNSKDNDNFFSY